MLHAELMKQPVKGWFKLLSHQEGEFYNVQIVEEGAELDAITEQLEVSKIMRFALLMQGCPLFHFAL